MRHGLARRLGPSGWAATLVLPMVVLGCKATGSSDSTATGALEVVLESDLSIPKDIDHVRLQVAQRGETLLAVDRDVGPGELLLPATFEVAATGHTDPVTLQGIAYKGGQPRVERDAVTPFPTDHVGELRLALNYLCVGTAESDADGGVSSTCPDGLTCVQGSCMTSTVPPAAVPPYDPTSVYGGDGGAAADATADGGISGGCFDVQDCFAMATPVTVNETSCTAPLPAGVSAGAKINVALQFPVGGAGVCGASACWVVFDEGTDWTLDGSTVALPAGACRSAAAQGAVVVIATACDAKSASEPDCGNWSSVTTPATQPPSGPIGNTCTGAAQTACGNCGTQTRTCVNGTWSAFGACTGEGVCSPGATQSCSITGGTETCSAACAWSACTCPSAATACGTSCVTEASDVHNCGACGSDCALLPHVAGAGAACSAGRCTYGCAPGYADCGATGAGCATSLAAATSCGACGVSCAGAAPVCATTSDAGTTYGCATVCAAPAPTLCGTSCVDLQSSSESCGACGSACSGGMVCQAGVCVCATGQHLCNGTCVSNASTNSCGSTSCIACPAPVGGTATCDGTGCGSACPAADVLCGAACVDEQSDSANCGGCGAAFACQGGSTCQAGTCACPSGTHACSGACVSNLAVTSCGPTSCAMCPAPTGGTATCDGNACGEGCTTAGQTPCNGACVDEQTTTGSCGGCGATFACTGGETCQAGKCACPTGSTLCGTTCVNEQTNSQNCGGCGLACSGGFSCQAGACVCAAGNLICDGTCERACIPASLIGGQTFDSLGNSLAVDATSIYWMTQANEGTVVKMPIAGGTPVPLTSGYGSGVDTAMALDSANVYFVGEGPFGGTPTLMSVPIGGGASSTLTSVPTGLIATDGTNVFFTNAAASGSVMSVPVGGGTPVTFAPGQASPGRILTDTVSVYWSVNGSSIVAAPRGGGTPVTLVSGQTVSGLGIGPTRVCWTNGIGAVFCAPLGGGTPVALASGQSAPSAIAVDATNAYWINKGTQGLNGFTNGTIMKVSLAGGTPVTLASAQATPVTIVVDATHIYWTNDGTLAGSFTDGQIMRLANP